MKSDIRRSARLDPVSGSLIQSGCGVRKGWEPKKDFWEKHESFSRRGSDKESVYTYNPSYLLRREMKKKLARRESLDTYPLWRTLKTSAGLSELLAAIEGIGFTLDTKKAKFTNLEVLDTLGSAIDDPFSEACGYKEFADTFFLDLVELPRRLSDPVGRISRALIIYRLSVGL